jgi:hypothetical protein
LVAKHNITLPDAFLKRWLIDRHADKFNQDNIEEGYIPEANYLKNHILEEKILSDFEQSLRKNPQYDLARGLGQLKPLTIRPLRTVAQSWTSVSGLSQPSFPLNH